MSGATCAIFILFPTACSQSVLRRIVSARVPIVGLELELNNVGELLFSRRQAAPRSGVEAK